MTNDKDQTRPSISRVAPYRILTKDKKFKNAGTDSPSWFNLENAKKNVNYSAGEIIVEHDGEKILWEVF